MTKYEPLIPIRRDSGSTTATLDSVGTSAATYDRRENANIIRFENLEDRRVISAPGYRFEDISNSPRILTFSQLR